jgi:serine/threonine protein kinase
MLQAGEIIKGRYQLQTKLGRNAGRQTWLAKDLHGKSNETVTDSSSSNLVVVKLLAFGGDVQWEDLKLFEREAQILQQLNHNRIPQYRDYFSLDERHLWFGLVQEYIPGNSLRQLLDKGKRFSELEVKKIAEEILNILLYLHDSKPPLLHRDIKPSNLILGEDNNIYLVDFGAVQDRAATEGATFTVVGSYGYAPMEQFGGKAVCASDLYALGATLIHLLTRTSPADLPSKNLTLQFEDRINIKPYFANWLTKITHPAVEKRYQTAREALKTLEAAEKKININLARSRFVNNHLLFSHRVRVINESNYLEITILKRGIRSFQDAANAIGIAFLFFISSFLVFNVFPLGIITSILCYFAFYPYLDYLFGDTKVIFKNQSFTIEKKVLHKTIRQELATINSIQDVSINYQAIKEQKIIGLNDANTIIVTTKKFNNYRGYQQYTFGKGLTEEESIWIANEIRNWLSSQ